MELLDFSFSQGYLSSVNIFAFYPLHSLSYPICVYKLYNLVTTYEEMIGNQQYLKMASIFPK